MTRTKIILFLFCLINLVSFSQKSFTNIDSLLYKNFKTVNSRDTSAYISLINKTAVFKDKKAKSKKDSLIVLKPFKVNYKTVIEKLAEMVGDKKFTVSYLGYETINQQPISAMRKGKIIIRVKLLVNSTIKVNMPFVVVKNEDIYTIETPMIVLFNDK